MVEFGGCILPSHNLAQVATQCWPLGFPWQTIKLLSPQYIWLQKRYGYHMGDDLMTTMSFSDTSAKFYSQHMKYGAIGYLAFGWKTIKVLLLPRQLSI